MTGPTSTLQLDHLDALRRSLSAFERELPRLQAWGEQLAHVLLRGGRLLAVGNGGSAAHAQHLTSELVGRYVAERPPLSAIALHAESCALTAIANDYGAAAAFARQVVAHGRPGDVFLAFSTSGASANVIEAAETAEACELLVWALTGPHPNALADSAADAVAVEAATTATVQEVHQVAVHLLCASVDGAIKAAGLGATR